MSQNPIYKPEPGLRTKLDEFRDHANQKHKLQLTTYDDLHNYSVTRLNDFWLDVWDFCGIRGSRQPTKITIDDNARIDQFPRFFEEDSVRINYAENLLCGNDGDIAVIDMNEHNINSPAKYTWKELRQLVARYAGVLKRAGLKQGDVVVLIGGNSARSLSFLLAAASLGCMFASFAQDIGEKSLLDRVSQLQPKLLLTELTYSYNGKISTITSKIMTSFNSCKSCKLVVMNHDNTTIPPQGTKLEELVGNESAADLQFLRVPFATPFVIMFSSGTTGLPKGIVHSQGGLMLNGAKEHHIHNNFTPSDIHFHYSGIGWTLWNISIGAMFTGATMLLYDGSPFHPDPDKFLRAVFKQGVTGYGGSPRYFSELQKRGVRPREYATSMHTFLSTGALLTPGTASWVAEAFGPVCQIGFSGGTELCGNFMTGTRSMPCYAGEIAVKELGMDVDAFGPDGKPIPLGEAGELVCKKPFPNMPVMFWNDPDRARYRKSYFDGFPGVWTHGDLIRINPATKGIYVLGRSDGVLNPSGVRFGTSDLYNILTQPRFHGKVLDGLAIGQQRLAAPHNDAAERVILFLKLHDNHNQQTTTRTVTPPKQIVDEIKQVIVRDLSRRHVPHFFFAVDEIPHNANGKKMEIQVKQVCNGGQKALDKMTLTEFERGLLRDFVRFYQVEDVERGEGKRDSKL